MTSCQTCRHHKQQVLRWFRRHEPEACLSPLNADLDTGKPVKPLHEVREKHYLCGKDGNWWRRK